MRVFSDCGHALACFHEGVRVSDPATVEVAKMVLLGKVNSDIVNRINRHGQPAVGLSGEDGSMFAVRPVDNAEHVGNVGEIERGVLNTGVDNLARLADGLGIDLGDPFQAVLDPAPLEVLFGLAPHAEGLILSLD